MEHIRTGLLDLYEDLRDKATHLPSDLIQRLGCPFLICPRAEWSSSTQRVLLVGQEPFDWGFNAGLHYDWPHPSIWSLSEFIEYEHSPEALMDAYRVHTYEIESPYSPTPFTRTFSYFMSALERIAPTDVISTNLLRSVLRDEDRPEARSPVLNATPEELQQILNWQFGCLLKEIELLKPTAVVFLTGPNYDSVLLGELQSAQLECVDERPVRQFAQVIHNSLPKLSFRTYHPGYLARGRWCWIEELAEKIAVPDAAR